MKNKKYVLSVIWLLFAAAAGLYVMYANGMNLVNSDDAGEMILAKLLSEGNGIATREWVYSSELRVINTQLIRAFLFRFTDSWTAVHVIGNLVLYAWLLLSYAFFMRQLTGTLKWFWYTAPFLLIPFSQTAFYVIGRMGYYIPHIALSFLILGLWGYLYREEKYRKAAWAILLLLSFGACLGGLRQLMVTFIPAWAAFFCLMLRRFPKTESLKAFFVENCYIWASTAAGILGYLINAFVLSEIFVFDTYSKVHLALPDMNRIQNTWIRFLDAFGYLEAEVRETNLFSADGIFFMLNLGFMVLVLLIVGILWKQKSRLKLSSEFLLWFSIWGLVFQLFLFLFTDTSIQSRYFILNILMFVPLLAVFCIETDYSAGIRKGFLVAAAVLISVLGIREYSLCLQDRGNEARMTAVRYLEDQGYTFGYGSFWNCNVVEELTEGEIEMVPFTGGRGEQYSLYPWLTKMDNLFLDEPVSPAFLLLHYNELNRYAELIQGKEPVYQDDSYQIYLYDSSDEFLELFNQE